MWPALNAHHDTPTARAFLPHQFLFNTDPLRRTLPFSGDGMAMEAKGFFARQKTTARHIHQGLGKEHAVRAKTAQKATAQKFRVGVPVWILRTRPTGTHHTKTWFRPAEVVRRIGEDTYRINMRPGQFWERHESQLRARESDICSKHVFLDYSAREAK